MAEEHDYSKLLVYGKGTKKNEHWLYVITKQPEYITQAFKWNPTRGIFEEQVPLPEVLKNENTKMREITSKPSEDRTFEEDMILNFIHLYLHRDVHFEASTSTKNKFRVSVHNFHEKTDEKLYLEKKENNNFWSLTDNPRLGDNIYTENKNSPSSENPPPSNLFDQAVNFTESDNIPAELFTDHVNQQSLYRALGAKKLAYNTNEDLDVENFKLYVVQQYNNIILQIYKWDKKKGKFMTQPLSKDEEEINTEFQELSQKPKKDRTLQETEYLKAFDQLYNDVTFWYTPTVENKLLLRLGFIGNPTHELLLEKKKDLWTLKSLKTTQDDDDENRIEPPSELFDIVPDLEPSAELFEEAVSEAPTIVPAPSVVAPSSSNTATPNPKKPKKQSRKPRASNVQTVKRQLTQQQLNALTLYGMKKWFRVICKKAGAEAISATVYDEMLKLLKQYMRTLLRDGVSSCAFKQQKKIGPTNLQNVITFDDLFEAAKQMSEEAEKFDFLPEPSPNQ